MCLILAVLVLVIIDEHLNDAILLLPMCSFYFNLAGIITSGFNIHVAIYLIKTIRSSACLKNDSNFVLD